MGPMLPIVNPVLWEIGHVGWFHEYWTLRHAHGDAPLLERADRLWNSSTVAHATRWDLDLPDRNGVFGYMTDVLERQVDRLGGGVEAPARYFYELAIRHEDMHVEALAYTRQTLGYARPQGLGRSGRARRRRMARRRRRAGRTLAARLDPADGFVFDNEKWAHEVDIAPFRIAKAPVTNAEFAAFVDAGGYRRREFWSAAGWDWRERAGAERPVYWLAKDGGGWTWRRYGEVEPLAAACAGDVRQLVRGRSLVPLGEAPAADRGRMGSRRASAKRARTAPAWPRASAAGRGARRHRCRERANLGFACDGPLDVAACAAGDSAFGCRQMIGNVWEWTASDFVPFPGFAADPYEDYSQPWFNTRKVLRGGSFATSARIARPGYRNFFTPERNDVIAGFRTCAL